MTKLDQYSLATVPVEQYANGKQLGCATSFVWKHGDKLFLITNWHVVTGRHAQTKELELCVRPEVLRAHFNPRLQNFGKEQRDIRLYDDDYNEIWYAHPELQKKNIDLVAIPLDIRSDDEEINPRPINLFKSESDLAVGIGMDVFILGYPFGYSLPGFPVWKRGSIASEPDLVHSDRGYLLVDTASLPGMSGAPVIRRSWGSHSIEGGGTSSNSTPQSKFIGVYSGRRRTGDNKETQLGMVWTVPDVQLAVDMAVLGKRS
jgi:Trypsin-like peptidase domain